jgi:hypothetical protein
MLRGVLQSRDLVKGADSAVQNEQGTWLSLPASLSSMHKIAPWESKPNQNEKNALTLKPRCELLGNPLASADPYKGLALWAPHPGKPKLRTDSAVTLDLSRAESAEKRL